MTGRQVLVSDLDGTLCFHEEAHGIRAVATDPDGTTVVAEPGGGRHRARDVSTSSYRIWVAEETLRRLAVIAERFDVVLVTGGRPSTLEGRRSLFSFASAFVLENGGLICDREARPHPGWSERLEPERRLLPGVMAALEGAGWKLDCKGRTSGIRVRLRDNPGRSADEFAALCRDLPLPAGLRKTMNLDNLDVILASAGKENAVRFWMREHGHDLSLAVGLGDDLNDLELLRATGRSIVLASAYPAVLEEARRAGWTISHAGHITGINEVLAALCPSDRLR